MKYFKYPFYNVVISKIRKTKFKNLDEKAKKNNVINKIVECVLIFVYFILFASFMLLIKYLLMIIENKVAETFMMIGMVLATLIIPIAVIVLIYCLLHKHLPSSTVGEITLENIQEVTKPLKDYYKVSNTRVITKCYKCTKSDFNNKDVIVYLYKDKIRITLDFNRTSKDFGCYEFKCDEIITSYVKEDNLIKTQLKAGEFEILLGKKVKPFIKKCFTKSKCPCCGYYTFKEIDRGLYDICPVCFWEDDIDQEKDPTYDGGANKVSLIQARKNFKEFGACEKRFILTCRNPKKEEKSK